MVAAVVSAAVSWGAAEVVGGYLAGEILAGTMIGAAAEAIGVGLISSSVGMVAGGMARSALSGGFSGGASAQQASGASPGYAAQARGMLVNDQSNVEPINIIYGRRRVGGSRVFMQTMSENNADLWQVLVLGEGEIDSVEAVYLDDVPLTGSKYSPAVEWHYMVGTDAQGCEQYLATALPAMWNVNHRLAGVAYVTIRYNWDKDIFTSIPTASFDVKGVKVYDPRTSLTAWSDNPALCIRDYLTDARYGRAIPAASIDDASFIAAANVCDELVSAPTGMQKRYTCNGVVNTDAAPLDNLRDLLTCCRGMLIFAGGKYRLKIDAPTAATFTFDESNIVGSWSIRLPEKRGRANRVRASFFNPDKNWQPDIATAESAAYRSEDNGILLEKQFAINFTSNIYRAQQIAQVELNASRKTTTCQFTATIAGLRCEVGDVVSITHSTPGWTAKPFRIARMTLLSSDEIEVTAVEYDADVYTLSSQFAVDPLPGTELADPLNVAAPSGLTVASGTAELYIASDGTVITRLHAAWSATADPYVIKAEAQYKKSADSVWQQFAAMDEAITDVWITPVDDGVAYDVRVRFVNILNIASAWATVTGHVVVGKTAPPTTVPWFQIEGDTLYWGEVDDVDLAGYQIRWIAGTSRDWGQAQPLHSGVLTQSPWTMTVRPTGAITLLIRSIDTSGNTAAASAEIITSLGEPLVANVVATIDLHATGFPGTKTNCSVEAGTGDLVADSAGALMWNPSDAAAMWSQTSAVMFGGVTYQPMVYEYSFLPPSPNVISSQMTIAATIVAPSYALEWRKTGYVPMWTYAAELLWTDAAAAMWAAAPGYAPWPGAITTENVGYDIRVTTAFGNIEGRVSALAITFDMPDISETLADVVIGAGGTRLTLASAFQSITAVNLTLQDDGGSAFTARVMDKDTVAGPLIKCFNSSGTAVAGTIDAIVQGY